MDRKDWCSMDDDEPRNKIHAENQYLIDGIDYSTATVFVKHSIDRIRDRAPALLASASDAKQVRVWFKENDPYGNDTWLNIIFSAVIICFETEDYAFPYSGHNKLMNWQRLPKKVKERKISKIQHRIKALQEALEDDELPHLSPAYKLFDTFSFFWSDRGRACMRSMCRFAESFKIKNINQETISGVLEKLSHEVSQWMKYEKLDVRPSFDGGEVREFVRAVYKNISDLIPSVLDVPPYDMLACLVCLRFPQITESNPPSSADVKNWLRAA